jgi:phosphoglycolate phosphatase-like HAD superfamily hydrolase
VVIFDFDQTLVDTRPVEALRAARKWGEVMARAPELKVYPGITALLQELHDRGQKLAIVTKSPDMVAKKFITQHKWPINIVVGYHQVRNKIKPDPEGLILAIRQAGESPETTFHVGDQPEDTDASHAAKVIALGVGWGLTDIEDLKASEPDQLFMSVSDLRAFLLDNI